MSPSLPKEQPEVSKARNTEVLEDIKRLFEQNGTNQMENIEGLPIAISITDKTGNYVQVNERFCRLCGYSKEELLGQHFTILVPEALKQFQTNLHDAFISGKAEVQAESMLRNKLGEERFILSSATLLGNHLQKSYKITYVIDITPLKDSEQRFRKSAEEMHRERHVEEAAENMLLHDMRKPVANIIGICNVLLSSNFDKEKRNTWLNILKSEANKSLKMLDTKAGFKKMELKMYVPEISEFDVIALVRSMLVPLEHSTAKRELEVTLSLNGSASMEEEELLISADAFFIEVMLNNLIVNAIEAAPDRSTVNVQLSIKNKGDLQVDIYNKGVIPEPIRETFFDKFSTFGKARGLGIGTYTAKLITQAHGGNISFFTSGEKGTTLKVFLPGVVKYQER
jgi:PAS domain S-box-containing protein